MKPRLAVACAVAVLTLIGFFVFPGHTYLLSDTQIYVPMMEHIWNPASFPGDLVAGKPHLSFTIYDEVTLGLRHLLGIPFQTGLTAQQLLFRAMQILGIYLLAAAFPLPPLLALIVAAVAGWGATIIGPSVLLVEYEPVPRGFAIGLIFLAIGLAAQGRIIAASVAASLATLYHAPTALPFWICFLPVALHKRRWMALAPIAAAAALLLISAHFQPGVVEKQHFFFQLDPDLERLQRLRAGYNWVSNWARDRMPTYLMLWIGSLLAYWRIRPQAGRVFLLGLPIIGLLSVPVSYLLLDRLKWGLLSQFQPARALLFAVAMFLILGAAAGVRAAQQSRPWEAFLWFTAASSIPLHGWSPELTPQQWAVAASIGAACAALVWLRRYQWIAIVVLASYWALPYLGHVTNYQSLETPDLIALETYARDQTAPTSMWLFPDAGKNLQPGIFRARAGRSLYVDWKAGGQVNYYKSLAGDWWRRWNEVGQLKSNATDLTPYAKLGVDYAVFQTRLPGFQPVYSNSSYYVYRISLK